MVLCFTASVLSFLTLALRAFLADHSETLLHDQKLVILLCIFFVQIRKSVRKKHTLPAYKLRYQPFFTTAAMILAGQTALTPRRDIYVSGQRLNVGRLRVTVLNCTRLIQLSSDDAHVYCTVSIGTVVVTSLNLLSQACGRTALC